MTQTNIESKPEPMHAKLAEFVRARYETGDPSHDFAHVARVLANARKIAAEEGADERIVVPAVYLHDVIHVPKNHPDRAAASARAAEEARKILARFGYDAADQERIATAVLEHSFSAGKKASTLEAAVVQDADRLDALGAVGIARLFACGTLMKSVFYDPADPWADHRPLDDKTFMVDHFFVKLFKLPELMNTASAREEAKRRVSFMRQFVAQLSSEVPG